MTTDLALNSGEQLATGLRRISVGQFDLALAELLRGSDPDAAVHEARKAMKRVRAILRLVRDEIGDEVYRAENAVLRDTARMISPLRDAAVIAATMVGVRHRYRDQLEKTTFAEAQRQLEGRHRRTRERMLGDQEVLMRVATNLRAARARYAAWPIDTSDPIVRAYGLNPIRHEFGAIAAGLSRTYRRGRKEMDRAVEHPTGHNFHQWRKRVKYLRHQMEILELLWPEVLGGYAASLDRTGDLLGEDHDLGALLGVVVADPELCPDPVERSLLSAVVHQRRRELRIPAVAMGRRIYAESPKRFVRRLGIYWEVLTWESRS